MQEANHISMYKMVQTIGNSHLGGANIGCSREEKDDIPPLNSAEKAPVRSGIEIQMRRYLKREFIKILPK